MSMIVWSRNIHATTLPMSRAVKIAKHFKMGQIVYATDFDPFPLTHDQVREFKEGDTLFVTNIDPKMMGYASHDRRVISYEEAMQQVENRA